MTRKDAMSDRSPAQGSKKRRWGWIIGGAAVLLACAVIRFIGGPDGAKAQAPPAQRTATASASDKAKPGTDVPAKLDVVASVNGEPVLRQELARECLRMSGREVLESLINKKLIVDYCQKNNIVISNKDVDDEIEKMARKFNLPADQWLKMLKQERGVSPQQYAKDIVWPTLALRRLASSQLTVTPQELQDAMETEYGPAVQCRMIVSDDPNKAAEARAKAQANPDDFANLAKQYSTDVNVASSKGLIPPIRRHVGDPKLEETAFRLREGQISPVVEVEKQFVVLKCEAIVPPAAPPENQQQAREALAEQIKEGKLRTAAAKIFNELQKSAHVENVMNDPQKSRVMPGVAATINDQRISIRELSEECIERHGVEILEGVIHRKLLEQALAKSRMQVTQKVLDEELAHIAAVMGKFKKNGEPDVIAWLEDVTRDQRATPDMYMNDVVWPAAALKLLVGDTVKLTNEDLQKGYEANYGQRVRCRAIVVNAQRRAQEVWALAREKRTADYFGELAEQYSIEAGSRALRGKVPPIQRYGGQPALEKEAFTLQPGELSGIIQVGDKFVILFCEGYTEPTKVAFNEVRDYLYDDLFEKKLQIASGEMFEKLRSTATVDNYLAGTSQAPSKATDSSVRPAGATGPIKGVVPASGRTQK